MMIFWKQRLDQNQEYTMLGWPAEGPRKTGLSPFESESYLIFIMGNGLTGQQANRQKRFNPEM